MNKPKTRDENIVVQEFANEVLIYDLIINKAYCLNKTSAMIWQLCDGTHSIAEINQKLSQQSNQSIPEDLIWLALKDFKKENLLQQDEEIEINFNGLSRRQIIKKVGLASMVMLPIISSIVAPGAAYAASIAPCVNPGGAAPGTVVNTCNFIFACNNILPPQCCSGRTTFTVTNCSAPNPGSGVCACAP